MRGRARPGDDIEVTPAAAYRRTLRERWQAEKSAETLAQRRVDESNAAALAELQADQRQALRAAQRREDLRLRMPTTLPDAAAAKVARARGAGGDEPAAVQESYATVARRQARAQREEPRADVLIAERRCEGESGAAAADLQASERQSRRAAQRRENLRMRMATALQDPAAGEVTAEREASAEVPASQESYAAALRRQTRVQRQEERTFAVINQRRGAPHAEANQLKEKRPEAKRPEAKRPEAVDSVPPKREREPAPEKSAAKPREQDRTGARDVRQPPRADDRLADQARAQQSLESKPWRSRRVAAELPASSQTPAATVPKSGGAAGRARGRTHRELFLAGAQPSSVAPTSCLQTQAGFLVDDNGDSVNLRGVSVRGLDTVAPQAGQAFPEALSLDAANLASMTRQWGVNLVRLPFKAGTILSGNGTLAAADLLAGLDLAINSITEAGAYVLLALEADPGAAPADPGTLNVWATLAARYSSEPRVFYELFCPAAPLLPAAAAQFATVVNRVRQLDPAALLFVSAGLSGLDTSLIPLRSAAGDPATNIVYTIAVSAGTGTVPEQLSSVSNSYPLFASTWADGGDLGRLSTYVAALFERCSIGWAAANWNSAPALVADAAGHDFTPTAWGAVARWAYSLLVRPLLEPAGAVASLSTLRAAESPMPPLRAVKNSIVDDAGNRVSLRGVTVAGLDGAGIPPTQTLPDALSLDSTNLALMRELWELNLVRVPFQAQTILFGTATLPAARVLSGLDLLIARLSTAGAYCLLTVQAPSGGSAPAAPDDLTTRAWQVLADRYHSEPGVLFELFSSTAPLASTWPSAAQGLIGTIRKQNSSALLLLGSGFGDADVTGLPYLLPDNSPVPNVAYTVNVSPQSPLGADDGPVAALANHAPVFALWSDEADSPSRLSPRAAEFFNRHDIHWAAANWNADPRLVVDAAQHDLSETSWGLITKRASMLPPRKPFDPLDIGA